MPRNPRLLLPGTTVFITTRTQEGLPFVATRYMELILWGILARAQEQYPVRVCHLMWMSNHVHMILTVKNPDDVPSFMRFIKSESASAVNRLLGRRARSVWCEGYDEPVLLTAEDVIRYIVYLYANPVTANLVASTDAYPGVSTWKMYRSGRYSRRCRKLPRIATPVLPEGALSDFQENALIKQLRAQSLGTSTFVLEPNAWMECFPDSCSWNPDDVRREIIRKVQEIESQLQKEPKRRVVGARVLRREDIRKEYQPKKFGRRMICISSNKELRKQFIETAKSLFDQAKKVYRCWIAGDFSQAFPPGLFPPSYPKRANFLPRALSPS